MSTDSSRSQIYSIQALRGLAALAVVIAHAFEHGKLGGIPALFAGRFGVEVFFVISGFVITLAAGTGQFDPKDFAIRRFLRVAPLYWATTFLVAGLAFALPAVFKTTVFDLEYFLKSIFFIPEPLPGTRDWRPLFKLGWTLNYEIFFYVLVGAFFWCRSGLMRSALLMVVMTALLALSFGVLPRSGIVAFYANLNLMPFMAGVVICELTRQRPGILSSMASYAPLLLAAALAAIIWALTFTHEEYRALPGHVALSTAAAAVVVAALSLERVFGRSSTIWSWLGNISYSLYLLHLFVVGVGWAVVRRLGGGGYDSVVTFVGIGAMIVASLIVATLGYRLFEVPLAKFAKRLTAPRRRVATMVDPGVQPA
jgi:peptidoglycan/LPS O-acetylase OafA/YrhL